MTSEPKSLLQPFLDDLGVATLPALLSPFDPGYDPGTVEGHLRQSAHLMASIKISMACWLIADERSTRAKFAAARAAGVPAVTGGGPFEIAVAQGKLEPYLDLCAEIGVSGIECAEGFTTSGIEPVKIMNMARTRGLKVQFEMGKKHEGPFDETKLDEAITQGQRWLDAGAIHVVVEARESAAGVGLFDEHGEFNGRYADRFAQAFGLDVAIFEAPNKASQFALLDHFGPAVRLGNVRLEEVLRVEIYRRGLHSDAFANPKLRPRELLPQ